MQKIIHLSDIHMGYQNMSEIFEGQVDRLVYRYHQRAADYVVVVTGDIVDDATNEGLLKNAKSELDAITKRGFQVLIVPGNHDYGTGSKATEATMKKYKQEIYGNPDEQFPRFHAIGGIAFIGLDSMEGEITKKQGTLADGEIGKAQLKKLETLLLSREVADCQYTVVYLHHHPIDSGGIFRRIVHGLDDVKKLKTVLEKHKIDALLFGHNHDGKSWNGSWDIKRVYDAGSSTGKDKDRPGPHRVMDLSADPCTDFDAQL